MGLGFSCEIKQVQKYETSGDFTAHLLFLNPREVGPEIMPGPLDVAQNLR